MATPSKKPDSKRAKAKNSDLKAQDFGTKHNKTTAHNAPEKRIVSKVRGR